MESFFFIQSVLLIIITDIICDLCSHEILRSKILFLGEKVQQQQKKIKF